MNSLLATLRQLGPARLAVMGVIFAIVLGFMIFISLQVSTPAMKLLYADLTPGDSGAITAKLEESKIPYEVSNDGNRILVQSDQVSRARILLAGAGLPNGGSMGYEIFDKSAGFGTTNFVQNINQVRALEGELARTIGSIEGVRSTRVHLVLPQRELFSRESKQSSASVFLNLRPGANISHDQIVAIQSLVSSSVPDLKAGHVSVIDNAGNLLARGEGEGDDATLMSMKAEEMRRAYETRLSAKVEDQVGRIVGYGNVRATVTADVNFDRISTNEEKFDPEGQVIRSSQVSADKNKEQEAAAGGNDVSVANNVPSGGDGNLLAGGGAGGTTGSQGDKSEEITNYEISKTVRSIVSEVGEIKKLSVAVLVDGIHSKDKDGKDQYQPRSKDEIDRITALVLSAVGFDEKRGDRIEVVNMQFAKVDTNEAFTDERMLFGFDKDNLLKTAEVLIVTIILLLTVLLVLRPMMNKALSGGGGGMGAVDAAGRPGLAMIAGTQNPALAPPRGENDSNAAAALDETLVNIRGVDGKIKESSVKKVEEIIESNPNETVAVLRNWMAQ